MTENPSQSTTHPGSQSGTRRLMWWARVLVYAFAFSHFSLVTADPDLWGHIHFGQAMLDQGGLHTSDPYSYTAQGYRWINHEWLMEIVLAFIYGTFDSTGLIFFKTLLGVWIIHLLSSLHFQRSKNVTAYLVLFSLAIPVMAPGFMTRPHLATFACMALLITALYKFFDGNHLSLRWLPILFLFWTNSHGGVVAGLGIFGLVTAIEVIRGFKTGERGGNLLLQTFAVCGVAALMNPYGYQLWLFFMESLGTPRSITEWLPVTPFSLDFIMFKLLVLLFAVTWVLPTRKRIWEMTIIVLAIVFGFKHQRHTVLTAIVILPYLCMQFSAITDKWDVGQTYARLSQHFRWSVNVVMVVFALLLVGDRFQQFAENRYKIWVEPHVYPTYAAHFMEVNGIDGNIAVPFDWGEYIIWKRPQSRVSIDGRFRTAYPDMIIEVNRAFSEGRPQGRELLTLFPTNLVLTAKGEAAHNTMEKEEGWVKIYQDPISKIFVRGFDPVHPALEQFQNGKLVNPIHPTTYEFPG